MDNWRMFLLAFMAAALLAAVQVVIQIKLPKLNSKTCGPEPIIYEGTISPGESAFNAVRRLQCSLDRHLVGSDEIVCQPDGRWLVNGHCQPDENTKSSQTQPIAGCSCDLLPVVASGTVVRNDDGKSKTWKLECDPNHELQGSADVRCSVQGQWTINGHCLPQKSKYKFMLATKELERFLAAAESGNLPFIEALLEAGSSEQLCKAETWASTADFNPDGATPLHSAVKRDQVGVMDCLLPEMEDLLLHQNKAKTNPVHLAVALNATKIVSFLVTSPKTAKVTRNLLMSKEGNYGRTPLHVAAWKGNLPMVVAFTKNGADLRAKSAANDAENFPIHLAAFFGHLAIVDHFLKTNPQLIAVKDKQGLGPIHKACLGGHSGVVKYLLDKGVSANVKVDGFGRTPLHLAAEKGNIDVVKMLIQRGADVKARSNANDGEKLAIHFAAWQGRLAVIEHLVEAYPDLVDAKDKTGKTPLDLAKTSKETLNEVKAVVAFLSSQPQKKQQKKENML